MALTNKQVKWALAHPDLGLLILRLQDLEIEGKLTAKDKHQLIKTYLSEIKLD